MLDLVEEAFDSVARFVGRLVGRPLYLPVRLRGDRRVYAVPFEVRSGGVAVIALVAEHRRREWRVLRREIVVGG